MLPPLEKGLAYLMAAQADDGGWHSETYGSMRDGAALTALVLYALSHLPEELRRPYDERLKRAYKFLQRGIAKRGRVAAPDGTLDQPLYGSAMTLTAVKRTRFDAPASDVAALTRYLVAAQLTQQRRFAANDPHLGGWDLLGDPEILGRTSDSNVSVTCFVLEALHDSPDPAAKKSIELARPWIARCQNLPGDGGFMFTPDVKSSNNKAEWTDQAHRQPRSYGTATCDGLRCLSYAGFKQDDPRVTAAVRWIVDHQDVDAVPGFQDLPPENDWQNGLRFYYYATLAKSLDYLPADAAKQRRQSLQAQLQSLQRNDGRWQNDSARMREDDPLIATPLAVLVLGALYQKN
jgi:hypothetical protein